MNAHYVSGNAPSRALGIAALATFLFACSPAWAIKVNITNNVTAANVENSTAASIQGILDKAKALWETWLPDRAGKPANHPQNTTFDITVTDADIDTVTPADITTPTQAKPTGTVTLSMRVNSHDSLGIPIFWDATPNTPAHGATNAEFSAFSNAGFGRWTASDNGANPDDTGFGKDDALTVILHEIGHGVGFAGSYTDFSDYITNTWNPGPGTDVNLANNHFTGAMNLMSNAAGFNSGGGRNFLQQEDMLLLGSVYGYMFTPEPSSLTLVVCVFGVLAAGGRHRLTASSRVTRSTRR